MTGIKPDPFEDLLSPQEKEEIRRKKLLEDPFKDLGELPANRFNSQETISIQSQKLKSGVDQLIAAPKPVDPDAGFIRTTAGFAEALARSWGRNILTAGGTLGNVVGDPNTWGHYLGLGKEMLKSTGEELVSSPFKTIAGLAAGVVWDGILRPILVDPIKAAYYFSSSSQDGTFNSEEFERKTQETGAILAGIGIAKGLSGVARSLTSAEAKLLTSAKNMKEVGEVIDKLPLTIAMQTGEEIVKNTSKIKAAGQGWIEGSVGGGIGEFLIGDTPEERFQNAFGGALFGGILGSGVEIALSHYSKPNALRIADAITAKAAEYNVEMIRKNFPIQDQAEIALDFARSKDLAGAVIRKVPENQTVVINNVPNVDGIEGKEGVHIYKNPDGTFRVLAEPGDDVRFAEISSINKAIEDLKVERDELETKQSHLRDVVGPEGQGVHDLHIQIMDNLQQVRDLDKVRASKGGLKRRLKEARLLTSEQAQTFSKFGRVLGELVSFKGTSYVISSINEKGITTLIEPISGKEKRAKIGKLASIPNVKGMWEVNEKVIRTKEKGSIDSQLALEKSQEMEFSQWLQGKKDTIFKAFEAKYDEWDRKLSDLLQWQAFKSFLSNEPVSFSLKNPDISFPIIRAQRHNPKGEMTFSSSRGGIFATVIDGEHFSLKGYDYLKDDTSADRTGGKQAIVGEGKPTNLMVVKYGAELTDGIIRSNATPEQIAAYNKLYKPGSGLMWDSTNPSKPPAWENLPDGSRRLTDFGKTEVQNMLRVFGVDEHDIFDVINHGPLYGARDRAATEILRQTGHDAAFSVTSWEYLDPTDPRGGQAKTVRELGTYHDQSIALEFDPLKFVEELSGEELASFVEYAKDREKIFNPDLVEPLQDMASRGLLIEESKGEYTVKNALTGEQISTFKDIESLMKAVEDNAIDGLVDARDLVTGDGPGGSGNMVPPPSKDGSTKPDNMGDGWFKKERSKLARMYDVSVLKTHVIQPTRAVMTALSNVFPESKLLDRFFDSQEGALKMGSELNKAIKDDLFPLIEMEKFTAEERTHLFRVMGTQSVQEMLEEGVFKGQPLKDKKLVTDFAKTLADNTTHEVRRDVYKYATMYNHLQKRLLEKNIDPIIIQQQLAEIDAKFSPEVVQWGQQVYMMIEKMPTKDATILETFSLADAMQSQAPNRAEYIKMHGLDAKKFESVAKRMDEIYEKYGAEFGIPDGKLINRYISHIRDYDKGKGDGGLISTDVLYKSIPEDFFASMDRTGLTTELMINPFKIMETYLRKGFFQKYNAGNIIEFNNAVDKIISDIGPMAGRGIDAIRNRYISKIRGFGDPVDTFASSAVESYLHKRGVGEASARSWVNAWVKLGEWSAQGFKLAAGARDAFVGAQLYEWRFGTKRMGQFISTLDEAFKENTNMADKGVIPDASVVYTQSAVEREVMKFTEAQGLGKVDRFLEWVDKTAGIGFKMSGQPLAYRMMWAASYLETYKNTLKATSDFSKSDGGVKARKKFDIAIAADTYDPSTLDRVHALVDAGKYEEAAKKLAFTTGFDQVGFYGQANHPAFMDNKVGRVLGQFGSWPIYTLSNFTRMATNANPKTKALMAARWGVMLAGVYAAQEATDFNLESYSLDPRNLIFTGGPAAQMGWFMANAMGSGPPFTETMSKWYMTQMFDPTRKQIWNPIPMSLFDAIESVQRMDQGDPWHIFIGRGVGVPINTEEYPSPMY